MVHEILGVESQLLLSHFTPKKTASSEFQRVVWCPYTPYKEAGNSTNDILIFHLCMLLAQQWDADVFQLSVDVWRIRCRVYHFHSSLLYSDAEDRSKLQLYLAKLRTEIAHLP